MRYGASLGDLGNVWAISQLHKEISTLTARVLIFTNCSKKVFDLFTYKCYNADVQREMSSRVNKNMIYILEVNFMFGLIPFERTSVFGDPFRELDRLERAFFGRQSDGFSMTAFGTDIRDEGDKYLLEADLPGFDKDAITLSLDGDILTISAERSAEKKDENEKSYIRSERSYGKFSRSFDVSEVDTEGIKAKFENGVLTLDMPKKQEQIPEKRMIEIE